MQALSGVSGAASKEWSLRRALAKMKEEWVGLAFHVAAFKDTGTYVVGHTDEIQMMLDDQVRPGRPSHE